MIFPPFRIGQLVRAIKAFDSKSLLGSTACITEGMRGEIQYYWASTRDFVVEWPEARNHPQSVHKMDDWNELVAASTAAEERKTA